MRLLQINGIYPSYLSRLNRLCGPDASFERRIRCLIDDRYGATQILKPILDGDPQACLTVTEPTTLRAWSLAKGMPQSVSVEQILLAQIEEHRTEVIYDLQPGHIMGGLRSGLPGSVKHTICWHASPLRGLDLSGYDRVVCNFPGLLAQWQKHGAKVDYFFLSHDPAMEPYGENTDRPIDIAFVGGYSRHHLARAAVLDAVARLRDRFNVVLHLDTANLPTRIGDGPLGLFPPFRKYRRPKAVRAATRPPVFGRDVYETLSRSKIVINAAIDMAGKDRGNMRCFEALGCGALLLSDAGVYPEGMTDASTMVTYEGPEQVARLATDLLSDGSRRARIAAEGTRMLMRDYSKQRQWDAFLELVSRI